MSATGGKLASPVRALVLDDSAVCRDRLREILESERDVVVVGEAQNGDRVLELIRRTTPQILVVDLQMPGTGGHETIERVMASHPLPILVVTGQPSGANHAAAFESIRRGALDLAEKPLRADRAAEARLRSLVRELARVPVVRHVAGRLRGSGARDRSGGASSRPPKGDGRRVPVVGIGASAGGPLAVALVLGVFPETFPAAIALVQHLPNGFAASFAEFLRSRTALPVVLVDKKVPIRTGCVYIPTDKRHLVASDANHFAPSDEPEAEGHRPAVDVLLRSLGETFGDSAAGVVMSGIGRDGAAGLLAMKARGALTLAQDEASSGVFGMPRAAMENRAAERALPPAGIAGALQQWVAARWEGRAK